MPFFTLTNIRSRYRFQGILSLVLACVLVIALAAPCLAGSGKRVLLLNSYSYDQKWTRSITEAVSVAFADAADIDLVIEFMDTKRHHSPEHFARLLKLYEGKYAGTRFDAVITSDDNAVNFAMEYRATLFPSAPIIFCGVNNLTLPERDDFTNMTGALEVPGLNETLEVISSLHPRLQTLYVVNEAYTDTGKKGRENLEGELARFGDRFKSVWLEDLSDEDMIKALGALPSDSAVLLLSFFPDKKNSAFTIEEGARFISSASTRPVYSMWEYFLGEGIVGGQLTSGTSQGAMAAEMALRVLSGEIPESIPVVSSSANRFMFDHAQLERFGIKSDDLPPGSAVVNKASTALAKYRSQLLVSLGIIALLIVVCIVLINNIRARRIAQMALGKVNDRLQDLLAKREGELDKIKAAEKALKDSEERYKTIVTHAPVGILMFNNDGLVTDANEYMAVIMGAPSPELIRGIHMLNDIRDEGVRGCVNTALATGKAFYENYYTSLSGNKEVYIRVRLLRINPHLLCGVFEDLTENKDMLRALSKSENDLARLNRDLEGTVEERTKALTEQKDRLKKANIRLQELDELKTAFLSSVSHELRTPLTSILGFTKITLKQFRRNIAPLIDETSETAGHCRVVEKNLGIVAHEGERLARLVNDVLDMARIESGRMPWNDRLIKTTDIICDAISASAGDFHQTDVALESAIDEDLPMIVIDPDKLVQLLRNLLHNAAKFTSKGSVTVTAVADGDAIEVRVRDTGVGINASDIDTVFDKFHQVNDSGEVDKPVGSGLGLAICKQIVDHYRGRIWVESSEGVGSSFNFRLPLS